MFHFTLFSNYAFTSFIFFNFLQFGPNFIFYCKPVPIPIFKQSNPFNSFKKNSPIFIIAKQSYFLSNLQIGPKCHTSQLSPHVTSQLVQGPHVSLHKAARVRKAKEKKKKRATSPTESIFSLLAVTDQIHQKIHKNS